MSQPFDIDPDQVGTAGAGWGALTDDFGAPSPEVSGQPNDPTVAAVRGSITASRARTRALKHRVNRTAGQTQKAAGDYQDTEQENKGQLGEAVKFGDITGVVQAVTGPVVAIANEGASVFGQFASIGQSLGSSMANLAQQAGKGDKEHLGSGVLGPDGGGAGTGIDSHPPIGEPAIPAAPVVRLLDDVVDQPQQGAV